MNVLTKVCVLNDLAVAAFAVLMWTALRYRLSRWFIPLTVVPGVLGSICVDYVMISVGWYDRPWETVFAGLAYAVAWMMGSGPSGPGSR